MALIECPECGKQVSDSAPSCPHCGSPPKDVEMVELYQNTEERQKESVKQIQVSFNRIHDKLFSFNSVFIAAYLVIATFPSESSTIPLWATIFPVGNLLLLILLEYRQMKIHRFTSNSLLWTTDDVSKYDRMNQTQSLLSLLSIIATVAVFGYLICMVYILGIA